MSYIILGLSSFIVAGYSDNARLIFWLTFLGVLFGAIGRFVTLKFSTMNMNPMTLAQVGFGPDLPFLELVEFNFQVLNVVRYSCSPISFWWDFLSMKQCTMPGVGRQSSVQAGTFFD